MHQGTTIINAEELFGDFYDPDRFQDCKDGFEIYWEWPKEMGNGFLSMIKLRPGLTLGIGNYLLTKNITIDFEFNFSPIVLGFNISENMNCSVNSREGQNDLWDQGSGSGYITYQPEWQGTAISPGGLPVRCLSVYIDPPLLNSIMEGQHDKLPSEMCDIINGADGKMFFQTFAMSPSFNVIAHQIFEQILNCSYQHSLKRLYFESKTLELIARTLEQFVSRETTHGNTSALRPDDIKRIHQARKIIKREFENPPTLFHLARQAGLSHSKLNRGFHEVCGTTVFGYLRRIRLEQAKLLLQEQKLSVTEVAFAVGYNSLPSFSTAFSKHFGIKPITCIKNSSPLSIR